MSIQVGSQLLQVHERQPLPPAQQALRVERTARERPELGDRAAVQCHDECLTSSDPLEDPPSVISQLAHGDLGHEAIVSR